MGWVEVREVRGVAPAPVAPRPRLRGWSPWVWVGWMGMPMTLRRQPLISLQRGGSGTFGFLFATHHRYAAAGAGRTSASLSQPSSGLSGGREGG